MAHDYLSSFDTLCRKFESSWRSNDAPRIEKYLGDCRGEAREQLFRDLLQVEIRVRESLGDACQRSEYMDRFPEIGDHGGVVLQAACGGG